MTTATAIKTPQTGDIIYSQSGYDCTLTKFYKVMSRTATMVTLAPIAKNFTESNGGPTAFVVPNPDVITGQVISRKVKISNYGYGDYWTVKINSYEIAQNIYETGTVSETAPGWY